MSYYQIKIVLSPPTSSQLYNINIVYRINLIWNSGGILGRQSPGQLLAWRWGCKHWFLNGLEFGCINHSHPIARKLPDASHECWFPAGRVRSNSRTRCKRWKWGPNSAAARHAQGTKATDSAYVHPFLAELVDGVWCPFSFDCFVSRNRYLILVHLYLLCSVNTVPTTSQE